MSISLYYGEINTINHNHIYIYMKVCNIICTTYYIRTSTLTWPMAKRLKPFWDYIFSRENKIQTFNFRFHWLSESNTFIFYFHHGRNGHWTPQSSAEDMTGFPGILYTDQYNLFVFLFEYSRNYPPCINSTSSRWAPRQKGRPEFPEIYNFGGPKNHGPSNLRQ